MRGVWRLVWMGALLASLLVGMGAARADDYKQCAGADLDARIPACTRILNSKRENVHNRVITFNNRGIAYVNKGDTTRAIADFTEAIRLKPDDPLAFNNLGVVYAKKGDHDRAIADFTEAIRLKSDYALAFNNRGNAYRDKGDTNHAIADYDQAIRLDPGYTAAFTNRGRLREVKGDIAGARRDYEAALALVPKHDNGVWAHKTARERLAALPVVKAPVAKPAAPSSDTANSKKEWVKRDDAGPCEGGEWIFKRVVTLKEFKEKFGNDASCAPFLTPTLFDCASRGIWKIRCLTDEDLAAAQNLLPAAKPLTIIPAPPVVPASTVRKALVIGNSAYAHAPQLRNPGNDARLVAEALRAAGFEVTERYDLSLAQLTKELKTFGDTAAAADWAVIYYAGHGIAVNGVNYLIPVDAETVRLIFRRYADLGSVTLLRRELNSRGIVSKRREGAAEWRDFLTECVRCELR